ncbi:LLM class flavin-dependent oxidoreductase [Microbacterium proteolyticum]|uniref:LLM class flavin-dependent oxidoreductase n=1 Tax=Microbacterium proteolyticum TaxID=1572644 RepID=UPI0024160D9F|nr:LLM class flavin-dependent oxidoreductase [Microbacterium proteolyticum]
MSRRGGRVLLNVNLQGVGQRPAAWQVQDLAADAQLRADHWTGIAAVAERGCLDAVFFADHPNIDDPNPRPLGLAEPFSVAATILAGTEHLSAVVSASTTYNDAPDLAGRLLTLDALSGGRIGWNVVTTYSTSSAANFGHLPLPPRAERYARAERVVDEVLDLWHASSDREPVLFQAGGSDQGRDLAARRADGVFTVELNRAAAERKYAELKRAAAAAGRAGRPCITPGLSLVIGSTEEEAQRSFDDMESRVADGYALRSLGAVLGADATGLDLDAPLPAELLDAPWDPATHAASVGYRLTFLDWIQTRRHLPVRAVLRQFGGYGARIVIGTPERVADEIEEWYETFAADGINLMLDRYPAGLETFVDEVVPLLQARGLVQREYTAASLAEAVAPRP